MTPEELLEWLDYALSVLEAPEMSSNDAKRALAQQVRMNALELRAEKAEARVDELEDMCIILPSESETAKILDYWKARALAAEARE